MRDSGGAVAFWPCPLDKWRISINHLLDVRLDSAPLVLKVPGGVLVNNVADEGVDCRLFRLGAVAGIHEPYCDAVLVVGFLCGLVLVVLVKEHHVGEGGGFDVARELLSKNERVQAAWVADKAGEMRTYELTHFVTRGGEGVDALCEAAARECGEETRTWLASWTGVPEAAARVLAGDKVWSVRRALADNVFVPGDVLGALAQDADRRVSERAELSQAYVRAVRDHNGDDAALYRLKAERAARLADERMRATRERVERDIQARFDAVRERAEHGVRERFGSNYSEFPNSSRRRDDSRWWDDSRGDVSPGNKPIVFMCEDEMVECASRPQLSYKDQKSLVVFGGERVHMALAGRDDLCEDAQMALVVHGDGRAQVALARRRSLSERVQVALAVHGDSAARRELSRRFDLCNHARRLVS